MAAITYKCPNCGGGLIFDARTQKYHCEFCISDFTAEEMEEIGKREQEKQKKEPEQEQEGLAGYICPSCGAQIVTDPTTVASFCYYCHNPVVFSGRLEGSFEPDYVIPFQIDRKKAEEIFEQWIRRKKFVPSEFYSRKQIETMTGIYFPYWLYGCRIHGSLEAEGRKLRVWDSGGLRYTETKVYEIRREGDLDIDSVARSALRRANRRLIDGVLPYRMEEKEPFSMGYLTGFLAESRDMEQADFAAEVQSEVRQFAMDSLRSRAGDFNSLQVKKSEADVSEDGWSYALLPVWTLTYNDRATGKIFYFALNGQTGKIWGELPVDRRKMAGLFLGIFLPLLMLFLMGGYFLG